MRVRVLRTMLWALGVAAGAAGADALRPTDASLCAGGLDGPLQVTMKEDAVRDTPAGEVLDIRLRMSGRFAGPARVRYAQEVVNDRGEIMRKAEQSPVGALSANLGTSGVRLSTPAGLPDGFYTLRVIAAASDGAQEQTVELPLWFRVDGGAVYPIDDEEFYGASRANMGVKL